MRPVRLEPMACTVHLSFPDEDTRDRWLARLRKARLDRDVTVLVEEREPSGKMNGPRLAAWLRANPGWHTIHSSPTRNAAWKAAWKIRSGTRRGFEGKLFDARILKQGDTWLMQARWTDGRRAPRPTVDATESQDTLF